MNRKLSREKSMEILFSMTLTKDNASDAIENFTENYEGNIKDIDLDYLKKLIYGVEGKKEEIDKAIEENLHNWKMNRISKVNLSILRLSTYELLFDDEIPTNVAINEALEITRKYSDEKSVSFVNGVLDKIKNKN